jgi:hypothetical protein
MLAIVARKDYNIYIKTKKGKLLFMSEKERKVTYTDNDRAIVNALRDSEGLTLAELRDITGIDLKPGHVVSAMKKGLIASIGEREILRPATREVSTYVYVNSDIATNAKGVACNYSEGETAVLNAAAQMDGPFTLAELASAMGLEKLSSGSINGLVKKGNIAKGDMREIETQSKSKVKVYGFVSEIPAE